MKHDYDLALKNLFSHPEVIRDLLTYFVTESWAKELDFTTLEKINVAHTSENLRKRESDTIWRIYFKGIPIFLIFLIEFQSQVETFMAVRILTYVALIYDDLVRAKRLKKQDKLPPIFPFVFHTGEKPWDAPLRLDECFFPKLPVELKKYQPQIEYALLDLSQASVEENSLMTDNLMAILIKIEKSSNPAELVKYLTRVQGLLKGEQYTRLKMAFAAYFNNASRAQERFPDVKLGKYLEVDMLKEKMDRWEINFFQQGKQEGMEEGIQQGMQRGRREMQLTILSKILKSRHGNIPCSLQQKMNQATNEELASWVDMLLDEVKSDVT